VSHDHDEADKRVRLLLQGLQESDAEKESLCLGPCTCAADAEALDMLLADCKNYTDALVRLAETCQRTWWNCHVPKCKGKRGNHAPDCPIGIGLEIIKERKEHGPRL
jgi:hypothetical protein